MLFADLVAAATDVAATSSRLRKAEILADALRTLAPDEIEAGAGYLSGEPPQGRIGVGWATLARLNVTPAARPALHVIDVDETLDLLQATTGPGSSERRAMILSELLERATAEEADFLRRLLVGELRQGALEGVAVEAIAKAADVPAASVRRAFMLGGDLRAIARVALTSGRDGLDAVRLEVMRPMQPMLASTANTAAEAIAEVGESSVEWKLDGIRIQVHKSGDDVRVFTRNLNDITDRVPEIASVAGTLPFGTTVLDGEAIALDEHARPHLFQDTMGRVGTAEPGAEIAMVPFFFDVLHADGRDLIDAPLAERREILAAIPDAHRVRSIVTSDAGAAQRFLDEALAAGHEGIMVKALGSPYQAGRHGKSWRKVKPAPTLDLVVLGAEWGHGRRDGRLSNLHLGARDGDAFVMVGKTFKGLTDDLLAWQTERFLALESHREGITVFVRPEIVVEIAVDSVQRSTRYPGGVALRFARVKRYREDKAPGEADTIESVRALLPRT